MTLGEKIASLRRQQGMTQLELAEKMGVTDKAVSKWERNLACPDVHTLPKLAQIFQITVDELMLGEKQEELPVKKDYTGLKLLIFRSVALAMGVVLVVLSMLNQLDTGDGFAFAGVGIAALALQGFFAEKE